MDRQYKAFISYRHLPLDMETAIKVHRAIEHYIVPKALRRDGSRRLGYVFRDEDELPISGELTENINQALQHSEYLIVICTPETSKSAWVLKEIETFLSLRDRSHVLLVLADGSAMESFPRAVTELRDENGNVTGEYEPLAANLIAPTPRARHRKFKTEILRILAALLGCSFDELYQRERRYQRRRAALLLSLIGAVAAVFIGMLLNRNAEISRQLLQSRINESKALSALSENAFRDGRYSRALGYALDALPETGGERPYVAEAEAALRKELAPYGSGLFSYACSIEQETAVRGMVLSKDGQRLYTGDPYSMVRAFDLNNGKCLWSFSPERGRKISGALAVGDEGHLLVDYGKDGCCLLSGEDGSVLWARSDLECLLPAGEVEHFLARGGDDGNELQLIDVTDGRTLLRFPLLEDGDWIRLAAISPDGTRGAVMINRVGREKELFLLLDLRSGEAMALPADISYIVGTTDLISFSAQNDLAIAQIGFDESNIFVFSHRDGWSSQKLIRTDYRYRSTGSLVLSFDVPLFAWSGDAVVLGVQTTLRAYDSQSGNLNWAIELPGNLCAAEAYDNESFGLVLDNGLICFSIEGRLFADTSWSSFDCDFNLSRAAICGSRFLPSTTLVIPQGDENTITVIRAPQRDDWEQLAVYDEDYADGVGPIFSPSGKKLVLFDSDYKTISGIAFDLEDGSRFSFSIPLPETYFSTSRNLYFPRTDRYSGTSGHFFLTEDFVLMNGPVLFRLRENSVDTLPDADGRQRPYEGVYYAAVDGASGKIATVAAGTGGEAVLLRWLDDEPQEAVPLPEELSSARCCGFGANGWALLRLDGADGNAAFYALSAVSGRCNALAGVAEPGAALCFGAEKPLFAWVDEEGPALYDLESGALLRRFDCELPADSLVQLCFARGDSVLMVFSKQGDLLIFDTERGEEVGRCSFSSAGLALDEFTRISVLDLRDPALLLVVCYDEHYTESVCAFLNAQSFELLDMPCSPIGVDPVSGRLLLLPEADGLYAAPIYSLKDLSVRAMRIIGRAD